MTEDTEDRPTLTRDWKGDGGEDGHTGPLFSPDEIEATRLRQQGLGVGAEELRLQRDPTGSTTSGEGGDRVAGTEDEVSVVPAKRADPRN